MVFLIEGIDGSGKSTAFEALKENLPEITYIKESYPGDSPNERNQRVGVLCKFVNGCDTVVYDRATALDDFVYEPVIGKRESTMDWESVKPLLSQCMIIYFTCDLEEVGRRLDSRGDEYITKDSLQEIDRLYNHYISQLPHVTIDTTEMSASEVYDAVVGVLMDTADLYVKKRPKLAHIVPRDLLHLTASNQYHMSLAHLIYSDQAYLDFYRKMIASGRYVLMDNGAAENAQLGLKELYECWRMLKPTELVLPDTLCDKDSTLEKTRDAIRYFRDRKVTSKFMAVPQGKTFEEWEECAEQLVRMPEVHCLGISKFLTIALKDPNIRYKAVLFVATLRKMYGRDDIEVHLLGCDAGPSEPGVIFKDFDFVRGCDTALAYIFAQAEKDVEIGARRPEGEMSFLENTLSSTETLITAMGRFNNIAGVVNTFGDYTWF